MKGRRPIGAEIVVRIAATLLETVATVAKVIRSGVETLNKVGEMSNSAVVTAIEGTSSNKLSLVERLSRKLRSR